MKNSCLVTASQLLAIQVPKRLLILCPHEKLNLKKVKSQHKLTICSLVPKCRYNPWITQQLTLQHCSCLNDSSDHPCYCLLDRGVTIGEALLVWYVYPLSEFQIWPFCILRRPCPCRYLSIFTLFVSISSRLYVAVSRSCCLMVFFPNRASLDSWPNRGVVALTPPHTRTVPHA